MNNKKISFFLLFVFFEVPAFGMDNTHKKQLSIAQSDSKTYFKFHSNFDIDFPSKVSEIINNPKMHRFAAEQFVCNEKGIINSFNNAAQRKDTQVHLTLGKHAANPMDAYKVTTLQRKAAHGKTMVALEESPSKNEDPNGILILGSNNNSNRTRKIRKIKYNKINRNFETMIETNSAALVKEGYNRLLSQSPMKPESEKETIIQTPTKPSFFTSQKVNFNASLAQRFRNLAADTSENRAAYIQTMNINDKDVVDSAIEAHKSGAHVEFITNHTALTKHGKPCLQKLHDAGVPVYTYVPSKEYPLVIQHSKKYDFIKGPHSFHMQLTGNATKECGEESNQGLGIPDNEEVSDGSIKHFHTVKELCAPYEKAIQLKEEAIAEKTKKRKAEKELKAAPAHKKKKTSQKGKK